VTALDLNLNEDEILASDIMGYVAYAPVGTTGPVTAIDDLGVGWIATGLIKDDGISSSYTKDQEEKAAWNVRGVVKRIAKTAKFSFKFTLIQTNTDSHTLYYGNAPVAVPSHTGHFTTKVLTKSDVTPHAWVIHVPMDDGTAERTFVPRGIVTDVGDATYTETDDREYELTVGAVASPGVDFLAEIISNAAGLA
jgi:hypothetical protein